MTKDEALKLALDALEADEFDMVVDKNGHMVYRIEAAITAIKEALAQPEQEPVAWMREDEDCTDCIVWEQTEEHTIPLYTSPPQRKPLTDEQLIAAYESEQQGRYGDHIRSLRAIEAAHGIKGE